MIELPMMSERDNIHVSIEEQRRQRPPETDSNGQRNSPPGSSWAKARNKFIESLRFSLKGAHRNRMPLRGVSIYSTYDG